MTTTFREVWDGASRRDKLKMAGFVLKVSPLLASVLWDRAWLWIIGEVDEVWPSSKHGYNSEVES